jgi:subtilisin family serine protease
VSASDSKNNALDYDGHGIALGMIIKGRHCGIALRVDLVNVKITASDTLACGDYIEKNLLKANRYVVTDTSATGPKILNLSSLWRWPSLAVKCAMQWAFKARVHIIQAAGNDNVRIAERVQYRFLVGAVNFDGSPFDNSLHGSGLDACAARIYMVGRGGTSMAAAIVFGAFAFEISRYPSPETGNGNALAF